MLSKEGLTTSQNKVEAIFEAPTPINITELKSFLGLVIYYSKFLPNQSTVAAPLYKFLQKDIPYEWSAACKKIFETIKGKLVSAPILAHFDPELPLKLPTDILAYDLGCVLIQIQNTVQKTVAIVYGVKNFKYFSGKVHLSQVQIISISCQYQDLRKSDQPMLQGDYRITLYSYQDMILTYSM